MLARGQRCPTRRSPTLALRSPSDGAAWDSEIVLKVQRPTDEEMGRLKQGQVLIGMLDPYNSREQVDAYAKAGVSAFAMELLPRTTRAQAMDVLSSQANLAGYKALVDAMAEYSAACCR